MNRYKYRQYGDELRFNYCPICGREKENPDFSINLKTKKYYCFSSDKGGTLDQLKKDYGFDFNFEGIDFKELEEGEPQPKTDFNNFFIDSQKNFNDEWINYFKSRGITNIDNINEICRMGKNNSMMIPITDGQNVVAIKYRSIDKKLSSEKGSSSNYFINWKNTKGTNYIIIVEGEIDLLSALETGHKNIISLPFGATNIKSVANQKEWLSKFEKIIIATDNDKAGKESKDKIIKELKNISHKLYEIDLGKYKDINEVLQAEGKDKLKEIIENHKKIKDISPLPTFYGEKGKFLFDIFSKYLVNKYNIINIEDDLYIYNGKVYQKEKQLEKIMIEEIENLSSNNRNETLKYLYLIAPEKEKDDKGLIAFNNGIYSIIDDKLYPFSSDYIVTNLIPWDYKKEEIHNELMDNTLNKFACNNKNIRTLIDEVIGYILFPRNQLGKAFIIVGDRANGKSTFLNCMKFMIGIDNTSYLSLTDIINSRFRVIETKDKLLNIGDDIGSGYIPESENLKKLITGDPMTAEKKGKDPIKFNCYAKFLFSANEIPQIKDPTGAMARRLIIIPFLNTFTKENGDYDPYFIDKIKSRECMEYLIYIGIEGLKRVLKNRSFSETEETKQLLKEFNENNNPIFEFVEYLENDSPNPMTFEYIIDHFSTQEIFEGVEKTFPNDNSNDYLIGYRVWAKNNGFNPLSFVNFKKSMTRNFDLEIARIMKKGERKRYFIKLSN